MFVKNIHFLQIAAFCSQLSEIFKKYFTICKNMNKNIYIATLEQVVILERASFSITEK